MSIDFFFFRNLYFEEGGKLYLKVNKQPTKVDITNCVQTDEEIEDAVFIFNTRLIGKLTKLTH